MKSEDVDKMVKYCSGYFSETWKLIKGVLGDKDGFSRDDEWDAIIAKATEWASFRVNSPYDFNQLTVEDQISYTMGQFLFDWIKLCDRANKKMRLDDGENVNVHGQFKYP